ncbi:MAG TPA: LCP family protein [Actinomycetes bacterium]|nr:LCP family protein [Actinomycetes bacterium]
MSDQRGGEENEPVESEQEPAAPPAPTADDQAAEAGEQTTPAMRPRTPLQIWLGRPPKPADDVEPRTKSGRRRRVLIVVLVGLLALSACTVGGAWWLSERYAGQVQRIPRVFDPIPEQERPDKQLGEAGKALNFLLAGTDRRSDLATTGEEALAPAWVPGQQRSDTIILVHLTADRKNAYVISFPRDSWVDIPGHGLDKINDAFSLGGPTLYVRTLEHLTGIRIDHLAIIDWDGFIELTDALGGVDVTIPQTTYDFHNHRTWEAGTYHLYGKDALDYVRQRYGLPRGDFDRVQRQQNFLREIMRETLNSGTLSNPLRLARVLDAVTKTVSVDDTMSNADLRGLALSLRGIQQGNVVFMTAPISGTGYEGSASVVYLDEQRAQRLYDAIKNDDVDSYLAKYGRPEERLGTAPA